LKLPFKNREEWRTWLEFNHDKKTELWLIYFKKHTKLETICYAEAVEEALCFGWIDGKVKSIDNNCYMQRFTPRRPKSMWSKVNKERVIKLIEQGKMKKSGLQLVEDAKKSGWWEKAYTISKEEQIIPDDLLKELNKDTKALHHFMNFTLSQRNQDILWINYAKRPETRINRIHKTVERASQNIRPGIM
jgi:uncharacterized protein YdeI (YjbR/CyaY-like superfamily)